jgi:hypothetical protein
MRASVRFAPIVLKNSTNHHQPTPQDEDSVLLKAPYPQLGGTTALQIGTIFAHLPHPDGLAEFFNRIGPV